MDSQLGFNLPPSAWRTWTKMSICKIDKKERQVLQKELNSTHMYIILLVVWYSRTWERGIRCVIMHASIDCRITRDISVDLLQDNYYENTKKNKMIYNLSIIFKSNVMTFIELVQKLFSRGWSQRTNVHMMNYRTRRRKTCRPLVFSYDLRCWN